MNDEANYKPMLLWAGLAIAWLLIAALIYYAITNRSGYRMTLILKSRIVELEQKNDSLKHENDLLWNEILYRRSEVYLEELARTQLGYMKPGEKVIRWISPPPKTPTPENSTPPPLDSQNTGYPE